MNLWLVALIAFCCASIGTCVAIAWCGFLINNRLDRHELRYHARHYAE